MRYVVAVGTALLVLIALAVATMLLVGRWRARQLGPDHPGVQLTTPPLPPARPSLGPRPLPERMPSVDVFPPAVEVGRHREDTVRIVPADWRPVIGAARRPVDES